MVCWNCRGVSSPDTTSRILYLLKKLKPAIFCLVETRANDNRLQRFCSKIKDPWKWVAVLAEGFSGGIIIIWNKNIGVVTPLVSSRYALHLVVTASNSNSWILSTIYNSNVIHNQRLLWKELSGMNSLNLPWVIMGDFNSIISKEEHRGGSNYYYSRKASVFAEFIASNNLLDVNFVGSSYTWCNNQQGLARGWARLDLCLVNPLWSNSFDSCLVRHLPRFLSDHSPLLMTLVPRNVGKKKIFRFENFWLEYLGCHVSVRKAWNFVPHSNPMQGVSHLLSRTRDFLLDWKNKGLHPIEVGIEKLEKSIMEAEGKDGSDLWNDPDRRQEHEIAPVLPDDLPKITEIEGEELIREVTKKKVFEALQSLPAGKSPGADGFKVGFYCFYWTEIGDALFSAIRTPFDNILTLQEVAHSIDNDASPLRMLIKLDIAKAYDTLSWSAILATLFKMGFLRRWISWIKTCICNVSYALLINKTHTSWFTASRGIRQGDPLSPYLFILVAQNLTTMLNYALSINAFNHLMYADNIILVSNASRKSARNIKSCLVFYGNLTGQRVNNLK
ncbi:uncharacterized protein LOC120282722 [Dioscorea cayenensis subsp. rotundata]|uniref:Uncharacterized protein LOC120282722 n=1 Tax=Dioscorea cayennensis subsp. rotundata TaxID=55577 RepID=A0AB40D1F7_DIOCR|nr:uncharacterized protein LOC120282722 [Dioscorea cayenensis subsp. rotundata]